MASKGTGRSRKSNCERCGVALDAGADAHACGYGCAFCGTCTREMNAVCPNCSGALQLLAARHAGPDTR